MDQPKMDDAWTKRILRALLHELEFLIIESGQLKDYQKVMNLLYEHRDTVKRCLALYREQESEDQGGKQNARWDPRD